MTSKLKLVVATGLAGVLVAGLNPATAAGTASGTAINNNVNVNFNVGGQPQTQASATNQVLVDRKIVFTNVERTPVGTTSVSPGQPGAVTSFTVTNTSNATLDFDLAAAQGPGVRGTDTFDVTALQVFVDADPDGAGPLLPDGVYTAGTDTATFIDELPADTSRTVFVLGSIPLGTANGAIAGVTLTATAANSGTAGTKGANAAASATNTMNQVDTVFADAANNGFEVAGDDYTVSAALLSVVKLSRIVDDFIGGAPGANEMSVPGATMEYCIVVSNAAGGATATNVSVSDNLTTLPGVTYDATFGVRVDGTAVTGNTCTPGATNGTYTAGTDTVSGTLTNIAASQQRTLVFRVTID